MGQEPYVVFGGKRFSPVLMRIVIISCFIIISLILSTLIYFIVNETRGAPDD